MLTGKGVTFDSGGLCLGECHGMSTYRGDLAGAAVIIALFKAVATMALPMNLRGELNKMDQYWKRCSEVA